jgi:hypothetical protein
VCLEENEVRQWIILGIITVVLTAAYIVLFIWARRRQKRFDQQYNAAKERHDIFVLHKKMVRERPQSGMFKFMKVKTYQVVGRVNLSQAVKGIQMSRMQTVTFQTTKDEYRKIDPNHRYKMDIAGNYIGNVVAPPPQKQKGAKPTSGTGKPKRSLFGRRGNSPAKVKTEKSRKEEKLKKAKSK